MQVFSIWKFCFECAITSYVLGLSDCPLGFKKEKIDVTLHRNITLLLLYINVSLMQEYNITLFRNVMWYIL